ncbi:MAG TPA: acetolactate synthase small subunit [Saprospiraceae bacterium]|nr:acetolactate synthase small subunit [Saprospiraceae bacterium]
MQEYTLTVFCENKTGLMARIVNIITRRHYNIESFSASQSSIEGIYRFTIMVLVEEEQVRKLVSQIEKQVDVLKAFYYKNSEIIYQEIALYKVPSEVFFGSDKVERIVRKHNARILNIEPEFIVIEKTGHQSETELLLDELREIGIYEFVRSGRVAITKPMENLNKYLKSVGKYKAHL